jgi:hypothetical protein
LAFNTNQSINADVAAKFFRTVDYKNYKGTAILFHINDFYIKKKPFFLLTRLVCAKMDKKNIILFEVSRDIQVWLLWVSKRR